MNIILSRPAIAYLHDIVMTALSFGLALYLRLGDGLIVSASDADGVIGVEEVEALIGRWPQTWLADEFAVLRRQGLLASIRCLNPDERLSPGQSVEIDRVYAAYPHLNDDTFVAEHVDDWLS